MLGDRPSFTNHRSHQSPITNHQSPVTSLSTYLLLLLFGDLLLPDRHDLLDAIYRIPARLERLRSVQRET